MHKYVIMGPQGSGKGTQAGMLARGFDLVHISVGDIFRWHVQNRTKLGTRVQRYMNEGQLVPDEIASVCDNCGGRLVARANDTPEAIRTRLAEYREKTRPIFELLRRKELIVRVDGTPPPDVVQAEMRRKLGLGGADAGASEAARVAEVASD